MIEEDFLGAVELCERASERANIVSYQLYGLDFPGRAVDSSVRTYKRSIKIIALGAWVSTAVKVLINRRTLTRRTVIRSRWIGEIDYRSTTTRIGAPRNVGRNANDRRLII